MLQDYYDILDLNRGATTDEIRKAYRMKAKLCHPDASQSPDAAFIFIRLKEAFDVVLKRKLLEDSLRQPGFAHPQDPYFRHVHRVYSSPARNEKKGGGDQHDANDFLHSKAGYILYIFMHVLFLVTGFVVLLGPLYSLITRGFDRYGSFSYSVFNLVASMSFGVIMIVKISSSFFRFGKKPF
jgi:hypothetical protein